MSKPYNISQLAAEFNLTTRTLRFYEEKGLLSPERKGTTRLYSEEDLSTLKLILRGKRLGFSLEQLQQIVPLLNSKDPITTGLAESTAMISEKRLQLLQQQQDLNEMLADLEALEKRYQARRT